MSMVVEIAVDNFYELKYLKGNIFLRFIKQILEVQYQVIELEF